ncbi:MAG: Mur ligase family protein [Oligoflexia bacterium]|nr:Mur ligase family protein [Oligoflexia bacterium]
MKAILKKPYWTYGQGESADFCFKIYRSGLKFQQDGHSRASGNLQKQRENSDKIGIKKSSQLKTVFQLKSPFGRFDFSMNLVGEYNVYNAVSALACALLTGFKPEECQKALACFPGVPGRLEKLETDKDFDVFIDYAHTPEALSSALKVLKQNFKRVILACGCGGDRDKEKRPLMAEKAVNLSDHVFWTTDNPRYEDPEQIAKEALKGLNKLSKITVELDREQAIKKAIRFAREGDCVLIAGKGHEQFQIVKDKKQPFCDKAVALNFLKRV